MLSHAGVPFITKNVELDLNAYHELLALGFRTVPVTIIGERETAISIVGFKESELLAALALPPSPDR